MKIWQDEILNAYFNELKQSIDLQGNHIDLHALELEWRALFPIAWVDFNHFLVGWMPDHWKVNNYSRRLTSEVISQLQL